MRLLIVGSLGGQLITATKMAMQSGAKVNHADTVAVALSHLRANGADLLFVDIGIDIGRLVLDLAAERIHVPVVACGVRADASAATKAIKAGAKEFIPLPPDAELIAAILSAVASEEVRIVWRDPAMGRIVRLAEQIAKADASVLITGESGTGKEVIARYVHTKSRRADRPFVSVNCAAIPEGLLESELFGHEKGAFTGAVARRIGKFEEANGGTLLLDEISEMDVRLQAKLLRALQERVIDRVGGSKPVPVDIRILATSNRDLSNEIKTGTFRADLLYRLNVVNLAVPPLRDRPEDILELAEHFVRQFSAANGVALRSLSEEAKRRLVAARWPGNVRELENAIHRAVLLAEGPTISAEAILSPDGVPLGQGMPMRGLADRAAATAESLSRSLVGKTVAEVERDLILDTLDHCIGNRTHAANILGISIRTLRNKLNQYSDEGIAVPEPGTSRAVAAA
ncbi:MAG: sigma-54 dependent transcriptional regulator [Bauldia sp.]